MEILNPWYADQEEAAEEATPDITEMFPLAPKPLGSLRPYWSYGNFTIYHGDSFEIMQQLDQVADLVVTDPPYGVEYVTGWHSKFKKIEGDTSDFPFQKMLESILHVLKMRKHIYVFGGVPKDVMAAIKNLGKAVELIWDKGEMTSGDLTLPWGAAHEKITFSTNAGAKADAEGKPLTARLRSGSVLRYNGVGHTVYNHPTEKPVMLLRDLIESSSRFGDIVFDPFMGSGSTLVAAKLELRGGIGIEIDEEYCEIAARRLDNTFVGGER